MRPLYPSPWRKRQIDKWQRSGSEQRAIKLATSRLSLLSSLVSCPPPKYRRRRCIYHRSDQSPSWRGCEDCGRRGANIQPAAAVAARCRVRPCQGRPPLAASIRSSSQSGPRRLRGCWPASSRAHAHPRGFEAVTVPRRPAQPSHDIDRDQPRTQSCSRKGRAQNIAWRCRRGGPGKHAARNHQ
jgi:hypothetical protein